jgi:hypothetical protein
MKLCLLNLAFSQKKYIYLPAVRRVNARQAALSYLVMYMDACGAGCNNYIRFVLLLYTPFAPEEEKNS